MIVRRHFERPIYAGNAILTVKSSDAKKVLTVRGTAFKAAADGGLGLGRIRRRACRSVQVRVRRRRTAEVRPSGTRRRPSASSRAAAPSARPTSSTSTSLPLADKLGAGVGASRAAVDAGYAPNDYQVGQTGKVVAPELYIAIGISGAIQHLAGMKDSKIIVAINKDEEAPIFQIADYGLVGDLFKIVPELTSKL